MTIFEADVIDSIDSSPVALSFFSFRSIIFAIVCTFLTAFLSFIVLSLCARIFGKDPAKGPKSLNSTELHQTPRRTFIVSLIDRWIIVLRHYWGRSRVDWLLGMTLNDEALMSLAKWDTGLSDFGADFGPSHTALKMLLKSAETESDLTPIGQFFFAHRLRSALRNRLRAEELFKRHPEILSQEIDDPLVITGLPRTGTTLIHRLLASDPAFRSLALWEALNPAPTADFDPSTVIEEERPKKRNCTGFWCWVWGRALRWVRALLGINETKEKAVDPRLDEGHQYAFVFKYVAPNAFAIHPCELDKPEEEAVIMDMTFMSQLSEALYRVPTYSAWLEKQDPMPMYALLKKFLQLLHWQRPGLNKKKIRWVLKTPNHLEWLDTLFKVFPKAQIIETHRDAKECLVSAFSASCHARRLFSDVCDPKEVAQHWLAKTVYMLKRGKVIRQEIEHQQDEEKQEGKEGTDQINHFIDVQYRELVKDPIGEVRKIYTAASMTLSKRAEQAMREFLAEKSVHEKYGRHEYNIEDFGMKYEDISPEVNALFM